MNAEHERTVELKGQLQFLCVIYTMSYVHVVFMIHLTAGRCLAYDSRVFECL